MKTMLLENNMHVMTQVLKGADAPHLPHGLSVVNMYTKLILGSKMSCISSEKPDGPSNDYHQEC